MKILVAICTCLLPLALVGQSRYSNKEYGTSLQFPSAYKLKEGELGDEDTLGYLGPIPMEFAAPGRVRVVTVEVPPEFYPNTDFNTAFVTLSVNRYLTQDECRLSPDSVSGSRKPVAKKISGMEFRGLEQGCAGLGHQFGGIYYHVFAGGSCYEIGEGIATSGYGAVDGMEKVNDAQVFAVLDKIIQSVTIHGSKPSAPVLASPLIKSLKLTPLYGAHRTSFYQLSWDVEGAKTDQMWLSAGCWGDLTIVEATRDAPNGPMFPCDVLRSAPSTSGSVNLQFKNLSGDEIEETVRLFVAGHPSVSKQVTITLPPMPIDERWPGQ